MPPPACIVVLNYNGRMLLERFLPSLVKTDYQPLEVVVVDNASTDDSVAWLQANWPQVTVLALSENRGWSGGNNAGARYALEKGHRYLIFANNDIEPHPGWVREAVKLATAHPEFGMIGFEVHNMELSRPAFEAACRKLETARWHEVRDVMGCSLFCDATVFKAIGFFDETYRFYVDETDFEYRVLQAGWRGAELNVPVWHLSEASVRTLGWQRGYLQMRNDIRFRVKLGGWRATLISVMNVLNHACNPWLRWDSEKEPWKDRYRLASWPVNAALALAAIGWNVLHLPQTRRAGRADLERIARHRSMGAGSRHCCADATRSVSD